MGAKRSGLDAWLRDGGVVVTASDRAARAIASGYHRARFEEGLKAWPAPDILDWHGFAQREWERRATDSRLVLNHLQEQALWTDVVAAGRHAAATIGASRNRLAAMAMEAHALLCYYASRNLEERTRAGWTNDAAAFSEWMALFESACDATHAVSANRVPLELISMLRQETTLRPPLLVAGFDRLLPLQSELFESWGEWHSIAARGDGCAAHFYAAEDEGSELEACASWCKERLAQKPGARLLVLTQDAGKRRGEIERAFLGLCGDDSPQVEFSLGVPLGEVAIAQSAWLLLSWLGGAVAEHQVDWLISTGYATLSPAETAGLQGRMRELRRRGLQRTRWKLQSFLRQSARLETPPAWAERLVAAQRRLKAMGEQARSPLEWAELVPQLLKGAGWPGEGVRSSAEFQAARRLQHVVDLCGSIGFDGRLLTWVEFLAELERALAETLFSTESHDAPILIAGPSESAGLDADAVWFLGASEDAWPARGSLHPLLPAALQRGAHMPHGSPQLDWDLAGAITTRLLGSAPEVYFSYPRQVDGVDAGPSRMIAQLAGSPRAIPTDLLQPASPLPLTSCVEDQSRIPLAAAHGATDSNSTGDSLHTISGGARVLTMQSQCPFKAFATARLGADQWEPSEVGLTPLVRGNLLHSVLHAVWAGAPDGISTLEELWRLHDRRTFVAQHVERVLQHELPEAAREEMPQRYLELEAERLTRLVCQWLEYESARLPFTVAGTELKTSATVGSLVFDLRLDRVDRLNDGSLLVIDYKTGEVSPKSWDLPRPNDVQLPLYGEFALEPGSETGGLVFAKVRAGDVCFTGRVMNPRATLGGELENAASLKKSQLNPEQLAEWRENILHLASDFVDGRADVDPREAKKTCDRCGLQTLCRIQERQVDAQDEAEEDPDD